MIVRKSSVFPASRGVVFEKLQKLETLQYIAKPYAAFEPVGVTEPIWKVGSTSAYRSRLFGLIPFGTHTIHTIRFDPEGVSSREGNEYVLCTGGACLSGAAGFVSSGSGIVEDFCCSVKIS